MTETSSTILRFGPYSMPSDHRVGDSIACAYRGRDVVIGGISDAPIQWFSITKSGKPFLILCGDLIRAVQTESEAAIAHHWNVNKTTVWKWRRSLSVGRMTSGTKQAFRILFQSRIAPEDIERGRERSRSVESRKKMVETKTGQPMHANTRKALLKAVKRPKSQSHRAAISQAHIARGTCPPHNGRWWTIAEERRLGTAPDRAIAVELNRSIDSVRKRRTRLEIPKYNARGSRDQHE